MLGAPITSLAQLSSRESATTPDPTNTVSYPNKCNLTSQQMQSATPADAVASPNNTHSRAGFPASDIDLFLHGLSSEQARAKIQEIYDAVLEVNPYEVLCFRSAHSISLVSQYPFRHIQIVLRLYSSPFEVLAGCASARGALWSWSR